MGHTGSLKGPYRRKKEKKICKFCQQSWIQASSIPIACFYPSTCSCPFLTPSRKPCNSLARLPSTNFSRMQASKHQVNCHRTTIKREKGSIRQWSDLKHNTKFQSYISDFSAPWGATKHLQSSQKTTVGLICECIWVLPHRLLHYSYFGQRIAEWYITVLRDEWTEEVKVLCRILF